MNRKKLNSFLSSFPKNAEDMLKEATEGIPAGDVVDQEEVEPIVSEPVYTHKTYSFYKDIPTNQWSVGEISFNPISGHVGNMKVVYADPTRIVVEEQFRILVGREVFGKAH
jgi:hypothetical protein